MNSNGCTCGCMNTINLNFNQNCSFTLQTPFKPYMKLRGPHTPSESPPRPLHKKLHKFCILTLIEEQKIATTSPGNTGKHTHENNPISHMFQFSNHTPLFATISKSVEFLPLKQSVLQLPPKKLHFFDILQQNTVCA